MEKLHS